MAAVFHHRRRRADELYPRLCAAAGAAALDAAAAKGLLGAKAQKAAQYVNALPGKSYEASKGAILSALKRIRPGK